jgi:hypothetical protein
MEPSTVKKYMAQGHGGRKQKKKDEKIKGKKVVFASLVPT